MYKKILAPLDGSQLAECTLAHTRAVAKGCQVPQVVLLRVIEPIPQVADIGAELSGDWRRNAEKGAQAAAKDYLAKVADNLKKEGITAETAVVSGMPANEILDYAKKNQVDLIVMSSHGRSGITRWVLGSVADRVLRHSTAPVLLVSPASCRND